jgi:hypothetical protein
MTLTLAGLDQAEVPELLRRAATAEPDGHPAVCQDVGHRHLFGDVERVVEAKSKGTGMCP